jgi:hypothetical protein
VRTAVAGDAESPDDLVGVGHPGALLVLLVERLLVVSRGRLSSKQTQKQGRTTFIPSSDVYELAKKTWSVPDFAVAVLEENGNTVELTFGIHEVHSLERRF